MTKQGKRVRGTKRKIEILGTYLTYNEGGCCDILVDGKKQTIITSSPGWPGSEGLTDSEKKLIYKALKSK